MRPIAPSIDGRGTVDTATSAMSASAEMRQPARSQSRSNAS
jgi:hypothetical protein